MTRSETVRRSFFDAIDQLPAGEYVALRRHVGRRIRDANSVALSAFFMALPEGVRLFEADGDAWFAAACIHCLADSGTGNRMGMPVILGRLKAADGSRDSSGLSASLIHRITSLLDTALNQDGYLLVKLSRIAKLVARDGYAIDCTELLRDLLNWNNQTQWVQRKWIEGLYQAPLQEEEQQTQHSEEAR